MSETKPHTRSSRCREALEAAAEKEAPGEDPSLIAYELAWVWRAPEHAMA